MSEPNKAQGLAGRWLSKKLGISGGAIVALTQLGIPADKAGLYIVIIAVAFVVAQGAVDVAKDMKGGLKLTPALLAELKETLGELQAVGSTPAPSRFPAGGTPSA